MSLKVFPCVDYNLMEFSVMFKAHLIMMKYFHSVVISTPNANCIFHFIAGFCLCTCDNAKVCFLLLTSSFPCMFLGSFVQKGLKLEWNSFGQNLSSASSHFPLSIIGEIAYSTWKKAPGY